MQQIENLIESFSVGESGRDPVVLQCFVCYGDVYTKRVGQLSGDLLQGKVGED